MNPTSVVPLVLCLLILLPGFSRADEVTVPNDFKTIQAAIDAATSGDVIVVSPGIYKERIQMKSQVTLRSAGSDEKGKFGLRRAEETIIDGGIAQPENESAGVTMAEDCVLDGFTVTNVGTYDEVLWQKDWDEQGANQSHDDIGQFGTPGIAVSGVTCSIRNCIVHHIGGTGIAIRGEDGKSCHPIVSKNTCYRNMGGGIGAMNGAQGVIDSNVCFENWYAGIGHDNAHPLVLGNECFNNVRAGIGISEGSCPVVRGNRCYKNRKAGIGIRTGSSTQPVVENNECYENEMAGIGADDKVEPIIRNNKCHRNKLAGIGCRSGASPILIGNECAENHASGIGADGGTPVVIGNTCEKNKTSGIGVSNGSRAILVGNKCVENKMVAVGIPGKSDAVLIRNELARTEGMPPIIAVLEGSTSILCENSIETGGIAGVMVFGEATLIRNTITGKAGGKGNGVFIQKTGGADTFENVFEGLGTGVRNAGGKWNDLNSGEK